MAAAVKPGDLYVKGALVAVKTKGGSVKQLRYGDLVTEDVTKESVDLLKDLGFVTDANPLDADEK